MMTPEKLLRLNVLIAAGAAGRRNHRLVVGGWGRRRDGGVGGGGLWADDCAGLRALVAKVLGIAPLRAAAISVRNRRLRGRRGCYRQDQRNRGCVLCDLAHGKETIARQPWFPDVGTAFRLVS